MNDPAFLLALSRTQAKKASEIASPSKAANLWQRERSAAAYAAHADKPFDYEFEDGQEKVTIHEDPGTAIGTRVWDCAMIMAKFSEVHKELWQGKSILEIGAGTGLWGMVLKRLGASKVQMTDLPSIAKFMDKQLLLNGFDSSKGISAKPLVWGKDLDTYPSLGRFDFVVLSDMAAPVMEVPNLIATLRKLFECNPSMRVLLGCFRYREFTEPFVASCEKNFKVEQIPSEQMHPKYQSPQYDLMWITA